MHTQITCLGEIPCVKEGLLPTPATEGSIQNIALFIIVMFLVINILKLTFRDCIWLYLKMVSILVKNPKPPNFKNFNIIPQ